LRKIHVKNTVRYYLLFIFFLFVLFFSNDFGSTDVQKTAIVVAMGIDREDDTFIVTTQIAVPQSSKQETSTQSVQIVSRGKTVGEALEEINAKTGWYPKLVFCDLIILGETAKNADVFDCLDFFLRNEYLTDDCQLAVFDGKAKDLLNTSALIDPSSSSAMKKVLSAHAERVGTVMPNTLREFSIGYFSESKSGYLPVLKTEPQQESVGAQTTSTANEGSENGKTTKETADKPVFSARETALFVGGRWVETLTAEETFAISAVLSKLRLASYSVKGEGQSCALNIRRNSPDVQLKPRGEDGFSLRVEVVMTAGIFDFSASQPIDKIADAGDVPKTFFTLAEKVLASEIEHTFEKCRAVNCDVFGVRERLVKYQKRPLWKKRDTAFQDTRIEVKVRFQNVR
jgi:Ger(x)C family germination protein